MLSNKFKINEVDEWVYVKNTTKSYVIAYLFVDYMLILSSNDHITKSTKKMLTKKFDIKNLGVADVILWIQISRIFDGLVLSESYYVEKILDKFSKSDNSTVKTSIDISI